MAPLLPRFNVHAERRSDEKKIAEILLEVNDVPPTAAVTAATAAGDGRKLRGIPAIGRGVRGAVAGSVPHQVAA